MRALLDSSAYSDLLRGSAPIADIVRRADEVLLSAVVVGELLFGFRGGSDFDRNVARLHAFLDGPYLSVVDVGPVTADRYGRIAAARASLFEQAGQARLRVARLQQVLAHGIPPNVAAADRRSPRASTVDSHSTLPGGGLRSRGGDPLLRDRGDHRHPGQPQVRHRAARVQAGAAVGRLAPGAEGTGKHAAGFRQRLVAAVDRVADAGGTGRTGRRWVGRARIVLGASAGRRQSGARAGLGRDGGVGPGGADGAVRRGGRGELEGQHQLGKREATRLVVRRRDGCGRACHRTHAWRQQLAGHPASGVGRARQPEAVCGSLAAN